LEAIKHLVTGYDICGQQHSLLSNTAFQIFLQSPSAYDFLHDSTMMLNHPISLFT